MVQIKKETANTWEWKIGNNANIAIFMKMEKKSNVPNAYLFGLFLVWI